MAAAGDVICLLNDAFFRDSEPCLEEVEEYASSLGIDLEYERDLLPIARAGLKTPPPAPWRACQQEGDNSIFFFNTETGESCWEHPGDGELRSLVLERRKTRVNVVLTLRLEVTQSEAQVVAASLAGEEKLRVPAPNPSQTSLGFVLGLLERSLAEEKRDVAFRFVLTDGTLLGYSQHGKLLQDVFHPVFSKVAGRRLHDGQ